MIPPATYKRDLMKASKMARVMHAESRDAGTDPMTDVSSLDPFARGASTSGDYYCAASGITTQKSDYQTALTSVITNPPRPTFRDIIGKPVATSAQRKIKAKRNIDLEQGETDDALEKKDETPDRSRTQ